MNAVKWVIDDVTTLYRSEAGYHIEWCCAFFGPTATLPELCEAELLAQCEELILTEGMPCELHTCDVGPFGDSVTVACDR